MKLISIYSISHFIVDFVCAIFILGRIPVIANNVSEYIWAVVIYNFFAFAFQVPLGFIMDKLKIYKHVAIMGMSIIGICYLCEINNAIFMASIVGIGNALFHLEGGVNIYSISNRKAFLNGLFVAPGAMGIFLGTTFHNELFFTYLPIILIIISIVSLLFVQSYNVNDALNKMKKSKIKLKNIMLIIVLIGISIVVRSIGGSAIKYTWKTGFVLGFIYTICVVLGKAFGGLIADKFGLSKVATIALAVSAMCLVAGYSVPVLAYVGILLFNIPMAITLTILVNSLKEKIACGIGLNTMFLFIGYAICFINLTINNNIILITSIVVAILSIYMAEKIYKKEGILDE